MIDGKNVQGGKRTWFLLQKVVNSDQPNTSGAQSGGTLVVAKGDTGNASYRLENHPPVSGPTGMVQGCNITEISEAKDRRLMEKQGMEEGKEVDSNKEAGDDGSSKQLDETESRDGENNDVMERKQQELSPKIISEGDGNFICNGDPMEDEQSVVREEDKTVSVGKPAVQSCEERQSQVNKDGLRKEDGLERETLIDNQLNDRQSPVTCNGPDNSDIPSRNDCADVPALPDERAISEKTPDLSLQSEPIPAEPAAEKRGEEAEEDDDSDLEVRSLHIVTPGHSGSENEDACPAEEDVDSDLEVRSLHIVTPEHPRSEDEECCPPGEDVDSDFVGRNSQGAGPEKNKSLPPSGVEPDYNESSSEDRSKHYVCLSDEEDNQQVALDLSMPQMKDPVKTGGEHKVMASKNLSSREDQCEAEEEETDLKFDKTNEGLENIHSQVESQFIGINVSGEDVAQWPDSHSLVRVEVQKDQETLMPAYSEALLPAPTSTALELCSSQAEQTTSRTSPLYISEVEMYSNQVELTTSGTSPHNVSEVEIYSNEVELGSRTSPLHVGEEVMYGNQIELTASQLPPPIYIIETDEDESDFDDRCPTPTLDEEPCQYTTNAEPVLIVTDVWNSEDIAEDVSRHRVSRSSSLEKDEKPLEQKPSSAIEEPSHHPAPPPDLEERTQRVLQSVEMLFSKSSPVKKSDQKRAPDRPSSKSKQIETPKQVKAPVKESSKPAPREREEDRKRKATYEKHRSSGSDYYKRKASELLHKAKYARLDPSYHRSGREEGREKRSSHYTRRPHEHSSQSAKSSSKPSLKRVDKSPHRSPHKGRHSPHKRSPHKPSSAETVEKTRKERSDVGTTHDGLSLRPDSSMTCTIFNTSRTSECLLEHLSQRCLQDDPTQATLERDWLIFADRMKQMVRKREPVRLVEMKEKHGSQSGSSPVRVNFSSLEEPLDDSEDHWPELPLFKRKIKVDMSDWDTRGRTLQEAEGYVQPAARKNMILPERRRPVTLRRRTEQSRKYDFCDRVMKEMSERFQSHLTSVVKSCQSKYKFYIHVTSDDPLFEETKVRPVLLHNSSKHVLTCIPELIIHSVVAHTKGFDLLLILPSPPFFLFNNIEPLTND